MSEPWDPGSFHPAVAAWFAERFPGGPTAPQRAAWPLLRQGRHVLVASPTGTGKTLTGFLVAIDAAYRDAARGPGPKAPAPRPGGPGVVYVSPLRALAVDVSENLEAPLAGIAKVARRLGCSPPDLKVAVRTGDTSPSERARMRRHPPDLLVTTPESLYLLLTAPSSRAMLASAHTVVVDEVHTLARDKRGAHLALSLERLEAVVAAAGGRLQRIGLSATQHPLTTVARLLGGTAPGREPPTVVDCGHLRHLDVDLELPPTELEAVASHAQLGQVLDRLAELVAAHRTTLVFVNTRRLAERLAHLLGERLEGEEGAGPSVAAHHGSLSAERRRRVEAKLRAGELAAVVATASLELGIDVGPVDLVCQVGSPRSVSTFLQRVGRANHHLGGVPKGRLFPLTRDELVECTALLAAVGAGRLDAVEPVRCPLDIVAQQVVAEVAAAGEVEEEALYELVTRAAPFAALTREAFDEVVELVSSGVMTGRGARGAHLHRDGVHRRLRPRRGARLAALTNGGAIPETGDYRVVLDPEGATVGSVHEDFAVEAAIGDVFLLGTHAWRVAKVESQTVRVHDAGQATPSVPFWLGEAPARTACLSEEVGALRQAVVEALGRGEAEAVAEVRRRSGVGEAAAAQVVSYLGASLAALGTLPTTRHLVVERFFDEVEGTQVVVHAPLGGRINRALGLALRKRFCVRFDFELQAAADDDAVLLSLGPQHSFPLEQLASMLRPAQAPEVLTQAVLGHPMVQARWRWNLNRALVVPRTRGGKRRPVNLQRMEADDVLAAAWPSLAACQDNAPPGPLAVPDHVLVRQTVADCLYEALDVEGLVGLLAAIDEGQVTVATVESVEPSPMAHGILSGRPYTFLDGAPLEERRSRSVPLARGHLGDPLGPPGRLAPLDPEAMGEVLAMVAPAPRDPDELHDLLLSLVKARPVAAWSQLFAALCAQGRASVVDGCWAATERGAAAVAVDHDDEAAAECVRGHLEVAGPRVPEELVAEGALRPAEVRGAPLSLGRARVGLARLEAEGFAVALPGGAWCARHLLARLHRASRRQRRRRVEPVSLAQFGAFLARWQHVAPGTRLEGRRGLAAVVGQLQGTEVAAAEWEHSVLPARLEHYDPAWLDELCLAGAVAWGRLTPRPESPEGRRRGSATPSPATPLALARREDLAWLLQAARGAEAPAEPAAGAAADLLEVLRRKGASFRPELQAASGRLPVEVDEGLWDLVARGLVTADAFAAVRSLLSARARWARRQRRGFRAHGLARGGVAEGEGRWSLLPRGDETGVEELAEAVAAQLLARWGVVVYELWRTESFKVPWRDVVRALRRLEARGEVLGGRFVAGLSGEQYALAEAYRDLEELRRSRAALAVTVAACDPLNLTGVLFGARVPAVRGRTVRLGEGAAAAAGP